MTMLKGQLDTLVPDHADVLDQRVAVSYVRRSVHVQERIFRITQEPIDRSGQHTVPEAEIDTCIPLLVGLPTTGGVHLRQHGCTVLHLRRQTQGIAVEHLVRTTHRLNEATGRDTVVTYLTPTGTDLDIIQPIYLFVADERFLAQTPSQGGRGEEAPRLLVETRRSISTEVKRYHITAVIAVVSTTEERHTTDTGYVVRCVRQVLGRIADIPVARHRIEDLCAGTAHAVLVPLLPCLTGHHAEVMFSDFASIGDRRLFDERHIARHARRDEVLRCTVIRRIVVFILEIAIAVQRRTHTDGRTNGQTLYRRDLHIDIAQPTLVVVLRITLLYHREGVRHILEVGGSSNTSAQVVTALVVTTLRIMRRIPRGHGQSGRDHGCARTTVIIHRVTSARGYERQVLT